MFDEGKKHLYENEKNAFSGALQKHDGMIRYLGDYSHKEVRATKNASGPEAGGDELKTTYNILLEFGQCDLDEYFIERTPPVLASEVRSFWKRLFDVAAALERIHNLKIENDGVIKEFFGQVMKEPGWNVCLLSQVACRHQT